MLKVVTRDGGFPRYFLPGFRQRPGVPLSKGYKTPSATTSARHDTPPFQVSSVIHDSAALSLSLNLTANGKKNEAPNSTGCELAYSRCDLKRWFLLV